VTKALLSTGIAGLLLMLAIQSPASEQAGRAASAHAGVSFETSDRCLACHNGLVSPDGEDVSIGIAWRASMMAHSSRDPYWQASVRRETLDHPSKKAHIEDECSICHMPMARAIAKAEGRLGEVLSLLPASGGDSSQHRFAADGVSCTLCHQIGPDRLGTPESFVGNFALARPEGAPRMFGPFDVDAGRTAIMRSATGVQPANAEHIQRSEVCATCHTLITEAFGPSGEVVGRLPEQVMYLEWRHSAYAKDRSCQSCHMPRVTATPIASVTGEARDHLAKHAFLGGNVFMLRMLNRHRDELGVVAPSVELDASAGATLRQLQAETATISVARASAAGGELTAVVAVRNLTGHKLPTGYPSRRAWLHVTVRDAGGRVIFESGAVGPNGAIAGNDNDAEASRFEPHFQEIRRSDQVQIYESIMADPSGSVTTGLLRATRYLKDNRLLPDGFDKRTAEPDIAVHGEALGDADFLAGTDAVRFVVPLSGASGPFRIEAELRFQTIAFRWADNLRRYDAPEPKRFVTFYDGMAGSSSVVLASAVAIVE
jgi:cytochrome c551/c552